MGSVQKLDVGGNMSRAPKEIAESLYTAFERSSNEFQQELYQYGGQFGTPPASKNYVDAAVSALAAALGSEQEETLALAGITPESGEGTQQCELVVVTYGLLFHTVFSTGGTAPAVQIIPRNSITSVTVRSAAPFTLPDKPDRLKFTVKYEGGLVIDFPLLGNRSDVPATLGDVLNTLRADLKSKL